MAAPWAMTGVFLAQGLLAALMTVCAQQGRRRGWWIAAAALLLSVLLFFTLASWGTSDPTLLSHYLAQNLDQVRGEPFWMALAPLIVRLPWRMALVHGAVVSGYAAMAILLARHWRCSAWGGWWALLICCSPLLRYFLQNGVSRQGLLTLLLVPTLLWAARLARLPGWAVMSSGFAAATVHSAFLSTLLLVLVPRALVSPIRLPDQALTRRLRGPLLLLPVAALMLIAGVAAPLFLRKLTIYVWQVSYVNSYAVAPAVQHLQSAMLLGVLLTCWCRRLGPRSLLACPRSRVLVFFAVLYALLQVSISGGWLAQIAIRFADPVGLFLLLSWLAWLRRHRCLWALLPALLVTLQYWLVDRLLASHALACGSNDEFLCVPDRWPWQLRY